MRMHGLFATKEINMRNEDSILLKLIFYAENDPRVRAMVLFGSRAREEKKADRFSDYDLIFFVSDVDYFVHSDEWLRGIAEPGISFFENTAVQDYERRVFFDDAMDMDFFSIMLRMLNGLRRIRSFAPGMQKVTGFSSTRSIMKRS